MDIQRLGTVPYEQAWDLQRAMVAERAEDRRGDTLLLLEHPSVYTAGRRTQPQDRPFDGTPVVDVDRGGKITWHGPGQLVGYPIMRLPQPFDVVAYVRALEAALIETCLEFGVETRRVEGRSGVWTTDGQRKVAAIGVRVTRGITMHGFALNCDPDLSAFGAIVPCGITDAGVTSLSAELGRTAPGKTLTVADAVPVVERRVPVVLEALARGVVPPIEGTGPTGRADELTGVA